MAWRKHSVERTHSGWARWGNFERLLPANNNTEPQSDSEALIIKRRLEVLQAVEEKVKDIAGLHVPSRDPHEMVLRVIQIRMSKLRSASSSLKTV